MLDRILVTGGSGMLGQALRKHLPDAIYLSRKDGDLREPSAARAIIEKHRPDAVLHLAARVGGVRENAAHNVEFWTDNALINTNVLSAARESRVRRLIAPLSTCSFPYFDDRATTEKDLHEGIPYDGNLGYGYAKRALDVHARLVARQDGLAWSTFTPVTMFGPHDNFGLDDGHVVGALVHKCVLALESRGSLDVWGDGSAVRQFVYVDDVARAVVELLRRDITDHVAVAADEGITIRELAQAVARAVGFEGRINFDASKPSGMKRKVMKSEIFGRVFGSFRFTLFDEALRETAAWFRGNRGET